VAEYVLKAEMTVGGGFGDGIDARVFVADRLREAFADFPTKGDVKVTIIGASSGAPIDPVTGVDLITAERQRQIDDEGWTPEHDASHIGQSLAWAAVAYAAPETVYRKTELAAGATYLDPWPWQSDKRVTTGPRAARNRHMDEASAPTTRDRIRELVKAGALIAAEIDRLS
jgi:hypothetical protein